MKCNRKRFFPGKVFIFLMVFMNLLSGLLSSRAQDDSAGMVVQHIEEGKGYFEEHYYLGAVERWGHALELDPLNEEVQALVEEALRRFEELNRGLEEGFRFLEEGDTAKAYEKFSYVRSKSSPKDSALGTLLQRGMEEIERRVAPLRAEGASHFDRDELQESRLMWEKLLVIVPGDNEALLYLSKISFKEREREKLLLVARGYFDLGVALYEQGRYDESLDQFENALAMNYRVEEARRYIDAITKTVRRREEREREQATEQVAGYLREGIKYYNLNRYRESLEVLGEGLRIDAENTQIREYILRSSIALKKEEEKVVPLTSPFYRLIRNLSRLGHRSYDEGRFSDSIRYWEEILLIFPQNEEARVNLTKALSKTDPALAGEILMGIYNDAKHLLSLGKGAEASAKLRLVFEMRPDFRDTRDLLARLEKASEGSKPRISDENRRKADQYYESALDYYRKEQLQQAFQAGSKAVELNPDLVDARLFLSRVETRLRNLKKAEASRADQSGGGDEELRIRIKKHYLDGVHYFINELYREAITEWEKVLVLDPSNDVARANIERALKRLEISGAKGSS